MTVEAPIDDLKKAKAPRKWTILLTVGFGTFMATLDGSIVNIALPTIRKELNAGEHVEWIILSYLLVTTSTLLIMGRLSDMFGRKRIYMMGFSVFVLGSFLCGLSWDIWSLVGFRLVQGLGASMIFAIGPAIISDAFLPNERGKALGLLGTVVAAGSSTGPVAGGLLLQHFGWSSIFYINVPIGLMAVWVAYKVLPKSPKTVRQHFDIPGAALFLVGVTSLLTGVDLGAERSRWGDPFVILLIATGLCLLLFFILWERKARSPMLSLSLFKIKPFSSALSAAGLGFVASGAHIYVIPFYLQLILSLSPQDAGLIMLAGPLTLSVAAPIGGYLSDKISTRWIASAGLVCTATGYFLFSFLQPDWTWHDVVWRSAIVSLGFGFFQSPNSSSALNASPVTDRGVASSLVAFMRNLGLVLGIALGAAVWYSVRHTYAENTGTDILNVSAQIKGMSTVYRVTACLVLVAALVSITRGKNEQPAAFRPSVINP